MEIYINNAGLVILNAYLPFFFERCGYLDEQGLSPELAGKAALLLQYVFNPEDSFSEESLPLNKLLCGLALDDNVPSTFEVSELEDKMTEQMLEAIISHWDLIKNSSPQGFRESWLWRVGRLTQKETHWELQVEERPFDVLMDYKPFSITPVNFAWMPVSIEVTWR